MTCFERLNIYTMWDLELWYSICILLWVILIDFLHIYCPTLMWELYCGVSFWVFLYPWRVITKATHGESSNEWCLDSVQGGYRGFYSRNTTDLTPKVVNDIHKRGGTVLGTSRGGHDTSKIVDSIQDRGINQVRSRTLL